MTADPPCPDMVDIVRAYGYDALPTDEPGKRKIVHRKSGEVVGEMTAEEASDWVSAMRVTPCP